jgi:hypothetical protein
MEFKSYYEWYNRDDPSSTYRPESETTFPQRLAWFLNHTPSGSKVLDYGCGEGILLDRLNERGNKRLSTDQTGRGWKSPVVMEQHGHHGSEVPVIR